ncbi:transposase [Pseudorhizobium halotolerans]|jgi:Transposase.|uniref:Transposase n=1 Tax=Pseudorhizobium halotolerans TaxID=1233081 RepID=A0ABM8PTJ5_9HYPH|nr:transposase [Pseudorhizobium halotolerans]
MRLKAFLSSQMVAWGGVSEATLYNWKAKYGGMDVSDAKRLKALEDENAKLKKLLADQMLEASALRELLSKNVWSASSVQGYATS